MRFRLKLGDAVGPLPEQQHGFRRKPIGIPPDIRRGRIHAFELVGVALQRPARPAGLLLHLRKVGLHGGSGYPHRVRGVGPFLQLGRADARGVRKPLQVRRAVHRIGKIQSHAARRSGEHDRSLFDAGHDRIQPLVERLQLLLCAGGKLHAEQRHQFFSNHAQSFCARAQASAYSRQSASRSRSK